jgi:twitching motility protein PilJ
MGNLADGDLTVQASVTEDVTGAIADSINFTIEELRTLVKGHQLRDRSGDQGDAGDASDLESVCSRLRSAQQEIQQASASV